MISYYHAFLSPKLISTLWEEAESVPTLTSMRVTPGLQQQFPNIETPEALRFVSTVYCTMRNSLNTLLEQRGIDRDFLDKQTQHYVEQNQGVDFHSAEYQTAIRASV